MTHKFKAGDTVRRFCNFGSGLVPDTDYIVSAVDSRGDLCIAGLEHQGHFNHTFFSRATNPIEEAKALLESKGYTVERKLKEPWVNRVVEAAHYVNRAALAVRCVVEKDAVTISNNWKLTFDQVDELAAHVAEARAYSSTDKYGDALPGNAGSIPL